MALGPHGPWLVTTLEHAREVLTDPERFDFPIDVSRRAAPVGPPARRRPSRSPHPDHAAAGPRPGGPGRRVFADELAASSAGLGPRVELDAMAFLREPVRAADDGRCCPTSSRPTGTASPTSSGLGSTPSARSSPLQHTASLVRAST